MSAQVPIEPLLYESSVSLNVFANSVCLLIVST